MITAARLKLGYYPLLNEEAVRIRLFLSFDAEQTSVLDPCAGTGSAFLTITAEPNRDFNKGKFGILVTGDDEVGLADFCFVGR